MNRILAQVLILLLAVPLPSIPQASPAPFVKLQWFNSSGNPVASGKLCSFAAGSSTPLDTYTTYTGGVANSNPTTLDSAGRAAIYLTNGTAYKLELYTSGTGNTCNGQAVGSLLWSVDNVYGSGINGTANYIPKFSTANVINASALYQDNTNRILLGMDANDMGTTAPSLLVGGSNNSILGVVNAETNGSAIYLQQTSSASAVVAGIGGSGSYLPLELSAAGSVALELATSGTNRTCVFVGSALRLLGVAGGNFIDAGPCP